MLQRSDAVDGHQMIHPASLKREQYKYMLIYSIAKVGDFFPVFHRELVVIVMQMCGRAGRPPFDDTGVVIIMTRRDTVVHILSLLVCDF